MSKLDDHPHVRTAVNYHRAVSRFAAPEEIASFFHPEAVHVQLPNALFPDGTVRGVAELASASREGPALLAEQDFEVVNAVAAGDRVAVEVAWSGVLAVPLGELVAGQVLRAHVAAFMEFRDGRIIAQRNYDCYERPGSAPSEAGGDA
ncbi:nuclear transport factor 2 family protein [Nocardiopsis terrae]